MTRPKKTGVATLAVRAVRTQQADKPVYAFFVAGAACRLLEAKFFLPWFGPFSLIPTLTGLVLLLGGWPLFRWAWPGLALLLFMLPLPYTLEVWLAQPLQQMATVAATYALQTFGHPAFAEGNVIYINDQQIGVLEACNGLGMLVAFFALSAAMAVVIDRRWPDPGNRRCNLSSFCRPG